MKATQSKSGLGRFMFLIAALAALMAIPAANASAAETPRVKVNMEGAGSGEVTTVDSEQPGTPPMTCSYDGSTASGVCENTPDEPEVPGYFFTLLTANPAPGSKFTGWSLEGGPGECPSFAPNKCSLANFEANEGIEWEVFASFEPIPFSLNLYVNGPTGSGTVTSSPAGISCSATQACSDEFEGPVTLTATPASGYAVAGWIGCKQTSATTCSAFGNEDDEEVDATAIFIKEGTQGAQGTQGTQGSSGPAGVDGAAGPQGAVGPQGPAGPQGLQGKPGAAGKVKVTCKVAGSKKVKCTVKQAKSSSARRLRWSLHRSGRTVSHGKTSTGKLQQVLNHLSAGRYSLRIAGRSKDMSIEIN